jgi:hypothetical protein
MEVSMNSQREHKSKIPRARRVRTIWIGVLASLAVAALALMVGQGLLQAQYVRYSPEIVRAPDANQQNEINKQHVQKEDFEAANAARKKLIVEESALLLKLAADLKTEVDKTNKDTLSLNVIRKADAIEKLARDVKEKMKLTVGPS